MSDSENSMVAVVAILAILVLTGFVVYFLMTRSKDEAELEVEIPGDTTRSEAPASALARSAAESRPPGLYFA